MKYLSRVIGFILTLGLIAPVYADDGQCNEEEMRRNISTLLFIPKTFKDCEIKSEIYDVRAICSRDRKEYDLMLKEAIREYTDCGFQYIPSNPQTRGKVWNLQNKDNSY